MLEEGVQPRMLRLYHDGEEGGISLVLSVESELPLTKSKYIGREGRLRLSKLRWRCRRGPNRVVGWFGRQCIFRISTGAVAAFELARVEALEQADCCTANSIYAKETTTLLRLHREAVRASKLSRRDSMKLLNHIDPCKPRIPSHFIP